MLSLYFDNQNGCIICNQCVVEYCYKTSSNILPLIFIPFDETSSPIFTTIKIVNNEIQANKYLIIAKINPSSFYISFKKDISCITQPNIYYEEELKLKKQHIFTAHENANIYYLSLETESEIYNAITPGKLNEISIKHAELSFGELITILANIEKQKYINILFYGDDYTSILSCQCDDIVFIDNEIILIDEINDSLKRIVKRHFCFVDGQYKEVSREFAYRVAPNISSFSIPYIFLESIYIKDFEYAKKLCLESSYNIFLVILNGFEKIILLNDFYVKNRVSLLYKKESQNIIKNFDFLIENNIITNVSIVQ